MTTDQSEQNSDSVPAYSWYVASTLLAIYIFSFVDRKLPFILVEPIKRDLGLSDTEIGLLTGIVFSLVYAIAALPLARFADRHSRPKLIGFVVAFWGVLTAAGGFATNFWQLALARIGVAVGESGCTPAAHSLLSDYFPERRRGLALSIYMTGAPLGILIGMALGGIVNDLASWRVAMWVLGAPGLLLAAIVLLTIREPSIRTHARVKKPSEPLRHTVRRMWDDPALRWMALGCTLFTTTGGAFNAFGAAYIIRNFGLSTTEVGISYGLVAGLGGLAGTLMGGLLSDRLAERHPLRALRFVAVVLIIGAPFRVLALLAESYAVMLACLFVPMTLAMAYAGPTFRTLQGHVPAETRATSTAVLLFMLNGIGLSLGPLLAGGLSDTLAPIFGPDSLRVALSILVLGDIAGAALFWLAGRAERPINVIEASKLAV